MDARATLADDVAGLHRAERIDQRREQLPVEDAVRFRGDRDRQFHRRAVRDEEAALFVADIFRMLCRYAESKKWKVEILSMSEAAAGGVKEVIALVTGQDVYSHLRYEGGVHRV